MITTASEHQVDKVEQMAGGKGRVIIERLLGEKELDGKCGLYAKVTIEPNCTLGFHEHHGETETYYILSGVKARITMVRSPIRSRRAM